LFRILSSTWQTPITVKCGAAADDPALFFAGLGALTILPF
jgi:hypothetical protein